MAYNDQTVAINPDGDGNSVFYSDQNPTINGQYIGGGYIFGADGNCSGHASAKIIYGIHHVASNNGYYIMNDERMFNCSDTFTTQQVINGSGQWVGGNIYLQGDGYITRSSSSTKISIWAGGTYQGGQIDYYGGGGQTNCGTLIFRTGVNGDTAPQPERMRISNDGNVGIGSTNPTNILHLCKSSGNISLTLQTGNNYGYVYNDGTNIGFASDIGSTGLKFIVNRNSPDSSMLINSNGTVGIGSSTPTLSQTGVGLHICGGSNAGLRLDANSTGWGYVEFYRGCTAKYMQGYRDVNGFFRITPGNSLGSCLGISMNPSGYVGIGVCETPKQQLEVHGNILLGANDVSTFIHGGSNVAVSADGALLFVSDSNTTTGSPDSDIIFGGGSGIDTDANRSFDYFNAYPSNAPRCEWMRIRYDGKVGIGTASPSVKLSVEGAGNDVETIARFNNQVNCTTRIWLRNSSHSAYWGLSSTATADTLATGMVAGAMTLGFGNNYPIQFWNGTGTSSVKMTIDSAGLVGIGTNSPTDKLHVIGADSGITICSPSASRPVFSLYNGSSLMLKLSANGTYGAIADNSGSDVMYFKGGCVSIGTSSPSYKLHVNGSFYSAGSSVDYKQNICQYNTDSCMFMKLNPVTYQYKDEWCHLGKELKSGTQIGLIAEDTAEIYPELAVLVNEEENKVVRNVDYEKLSIILLSEVQKLRKEVDNLKNNK